MNIIYIYIYIYIYIKFPCNYCAMKIIKHRITKIFYLWDKNYNKEKIIRTKMIFDLANVTYKYYIFETSIYLMY